ncbi:MAG: helix-turn-helix transcriptional regulator [Chloroflexota bacterium]|nr:MAG: helix-turn-helix transcriptional regulator [Chloroflexota bacterium]
MNLQPVSSLLRAISQPARIEILLAIGSGEACVCHLEIATGQRQAYISQQLMALRSAGIVTSRREGRNVYYRLEDPSILELIQHAATLTSIDRREIQAFGSTNLHGKCPCPKCDREASEIN